MEFPKDIICIKSMPNPAFDANSKKWIYLFESELVYKDKIYKAIDGDEDYYAIEGKDFSVGYTKSIFSDINEIQISEIIEILKEEPCLI